MAIKGGRPTNRRVVPHLLVRDAKKAVEFYQRGLGAEVLYRSSLPDGKVMHAQLRIADSVILVTWENLHSEQSAVPRNDPRRSMPAPWSISPNRAPCAPTRLA